MKLPRKINNKSIRIIPLLLICTFLYSQNTITGTFSHLTQESVKLVGFEGFETYTIDSTRIDQNGRFTLSYVKHEYGMGYLSIGNRTPFFIILNGENIELKGHNFAATETIDILHGKETRLFKQYALEHPRRKQTLNAWQYLENVYANDSLFAVHAIPKQAIANEKERIKAEDQKFIESFVPDSYVGYYLSIRNLAGSVSTITSYQTKDIPKTIDTFRELDYGEPRLLKSGLLADVIESHFWLIENSGHSLDTVYREMKVSIDMMIENLLHDDAKLNQITEYLFKYLEKRSLFKASEYLALKLLSEQGCSIDDNFSAQLESYRTMKVGNIAPDIRFTNDVFAPQFETSTYP